MPLFEKFFENFICPSLTSMKLESCMKCAVGTFPLHAFTDFLLHSACSITTLSFLDVSLPTPLLVSLLRLIPTLNSLDIIEGERDSVIPPMVTDDFLRLLRIHSSSALHPLLPRLANLSLSTPGASSVFTDQLFIDMVTSRFGRSRVAAYSGSSSTRTDAVHAGSRDSDRNAVNSGAEIASIESVELKLRDRSFSSALYERLRYLRMAGLPICVWDSEGSLEVRIDVY